MMSLLAYLGFDDDKQRTLERLEDFIEWKAHDRFWEYIDESCYADEIKCTIRLWEPLLGETGQYEIMALTCKKAESPDCSVQDFIEKNRSVLEYFVLEGYRHSDSGVAKAADAFKAILEGKAVPFGERSCYQLGDTLIVLEAPPESDIYSSDGSIHAICKILGRSQHKEKPV